MLENGEDALILASSIAQAGTRRFAQGIHMVAG